MRARHYTSGVHWQCIYWPSCLLYLNVGSASTSRLTATAHEFSKRLGHSVLESTARKFCDLCLSELEKQRQSWGVSPWCHGRFASSFSARSLTLAKGQVCAACYKQVCLYQRTDLRCLWILKEAGALSAGVNFKKVLWYIVERATPIYQWFYNTPHHIPTSEKLRTSTSVGRVRFSGDQIHPEA